MDIAALDGLTLHYRIDGQADGAPVVFLNSLGTDLRLWDKVLPRLPSGLRLIRCDTRGHGLSGCPAGPYAMGALVSDVERLLDRLEVRDCVLVGVSLGGMVAQALAVKRPDQVRALVLSNTAAKIGTREMWEDRMAAAREGGLEALAPAILERWFSRGFRDLPELAGWRAMLVRTPLDGYLGCCAAIAGTDMMAATATLKLPTLAIAGDQDGSTPPDLVRETAALIDGAEVTLIRQAGHLPCVEQPDVYAQTLIGFLARLGHLGGFHG
ncbi:3-oxoadipate enol-lactonase [Rhodobacteraceae bacterium CCMM004]|nr:3-oxoadipate enol-lactonase [Rhodobacteraceae bacterium CCMM004]